MSALDFLLNLAALLLWLSWRSLRFEPRHRILPATLAGTLKPARPRQLKGWPFILGLALLLGLRAVIYWQIGSPADWTPKLNLGIVVLAFRSDSFPASSSLCATLIFSVLAFARAMTVFYFWLLVTGLINRGAKQPSPILKLIRMHLGRLGRLPWPLQLALFPMLVAFVWIGLHPLLFRLEVTGPVQSTIHLIEQGLLVGAQLFLTLKFLLPGFLFLHLIASYVYLGGGGFWEFVSETARRLLAPLQPLSLRFAKLDFTPVAGVALIFLLLQWLPDYLSAKLAAKNLALWPQ